jgi:glutathione S-transferase
MKLYFSPGACSLAPHIALREAGLKFDMEQVDLRAHKTKGGADYYTINAKGYVPALALDNGGTLTEAAVILQYIADRKPESKLAPSPTSEERYRLQEWLNYVSTEIHKTFGPLFHSASEDAKEDARKKLAKRFEFVARSLEGKPYLMGDTFTVADAYLFTMLGWTGSQQIDLGKWPTLKAYFERVGARPAVKAALEAEGQK